MPWSSRTRNARSSRAVSWAYRVYPSSPVLGRVVPAGLTEQFVNAAEVAQKDRDVDVGMRSRQPARVEVYRPATEHQIVDPLLLEQAVPLPRAWS